MSAFDVTASSCRSRVRTSPPAPERRCCVDGDGYLASATGGSGGDRYTSAVHVLFVCTANICRSPMAAALLAEHPDARGGAVGVASTGLLEAGRPVPDEVLAAMAPRGIDLSGHRSTTLSPPMLEDADLVLGMARRHVQEVVLLDPGSLSHTFRLKEFVRRATAVGPRRAGQSVEDWVTEVHGSRDRASLLAREPGDDVRDPYGGPAAGYRATASELELLVGKVAGLLRPGG